VLGLESDQVSTHLLDDAGWQVLQGDGSRGRTRSGPIRRALRDGTAVTDVTMGLRHGGRTHWLKVSAKPLRRDGSDRPYAALATFIDLTERLAAQTALEESESHFRLLAENSTDVITRHLADGTCLYASPALRDLLGRDPQELQGRQAIEFVHVEDPRPAGRGAGGAAALGRGCRPPATGWRTATAAGCGSRR
jgi:PAS domain-containing protein